MYASQARHQALVWLRLLLVAVVVVLTVSAVPFAFSMCVWLVCCWCCADVLHLQWHVALCGVVPVVGTQCVACKADHKTVACCYTSFWQNGSATMAATNNISCNMLQWCYANVLVNQWSCCGQQGSAPAAAATAATFM